jgi:hypothetical protein
LNLIFALGALAAAPQPPQDHPIDLKDGTQVDAEYYASGTPRGTLLFLSGDGEGAGSGFDAEFQDKCETFQREGWNVIALQSIRWLHEVGDRVSKEPGCFDIGAELQKKVASLKLPIPAPKCMPLVGFSYGTTLGTVAYLQNPSRWCGVTTLSWCHDVPLSYIQPDKKVCGPADEKEGFTYDAAGNMNLNRYTGPRHSLIVQGINDDTCNYADTNLYLLSTNGDLNDSPKHHLRRITVPGANHGLFHTVNGKRVYPWIQDFNAELEHLQKPASANESCQ